MQWWGQGRRRRRGCGGGDGSDGGRGDGGRGDGGGGDGSDGKGDGGRGDGGRLVTENGWLLGNQLLESFYMGRLIAFERNIGRRRHTVEELDAGIDSWEAEFAMDLEAVSEITH